MIIKWSYYQPYHYHIILLSWVLVDAGPAPNQTCDSRSLLSAADWGWKRQTAVRPGVSLDQPAWWDFDQNRAFVSEWALNGAMVAGAPRGGGGGGVEQIGDLILSTMWLFSMATTKIDHSDHHFQLSATGWSQVRGVWANSKRPSSFLWSFTTSIMSTSSRGVSTRWTNHFNSDFMLSCITTLDPLSISRSPWYWSPWWFSGAVQHSHLA